MLIAEEEINNDVEPEKINEVIEEYSEEITIEVVNGEGVETLIEKSEISESIKYHEQENINLQELKIENSLTTGQGFHKSSDNEEVQGLLSEPTELLQIDIESNQNTEIIQTIHKKAKRVIEVNSHNNLDDSEIDKHILTEKLASLQINETLLSSFKDKANYMDLSKVDTAYNTLSDNTRGELDKITEAQSKIYNKILWINILGDQISKDNESKALLFDERATEKRYDELQKFEIEVGKTRGYLDLLSSRMKLIEKDLDQYFYKILKEHQMS